MLMNAFQNAGRTRLNWFGRVGLLLLWCLRQGILFGLRSRLSCGGFKVGHGFWFGSARGLWASCRFLPFLGWADTGKQSACCDGSEENRSSGWSFLENEMKLAFKVSGWALHLDSFSTEATSVAKWIVRQQVLLHWKKFHPLNQHAWGSKVALLWIDSFCMSGVKEIATTLLYISYL